MLVIQHCGHVDQVGGHHVDVNRDPAIGACKDGSPNLLIPLQSDLLRRAASVYYAHVVGLGKRVRLLPIVLV